MRNRCEFDESAGRMPEALNDRRLTAAREDDEVRAGNDQQRFALGQANHVFRQMLPGTVRTRVSVVQAPKIFVRSVSHRHFLTAHSKWLAIYKRRLGHPLKR